MKKRFLLVLVVAISLTSCALSRKSQKRKIGEEITTSSGLKFKLLVRGKGVKADSGDVVNISYIGKSTNDSIFFSSYTSLDLKSKHPVKMALGRGWVFKGFDEGIRLMHVGDSAQLTIPPNLGYGSKEIHSIPPNSTLIVNVKLLKVEKPPKPFDVKGKDTLSTPSGLKYIMVKSNPDGEKIEKDYLVNYYYTAFLKNGEIFGSTFYYNRKSNALRAGGGDVIKGLDEAILLLRKGEKARILVPSDLAYGKKGLENNVPPNCDFIYDINIINVQKKTDKEWLQIPLE